MVKLGLLIESTVIMVGFKTVAIIIAASALTAVPLYLDNLTDLLKAVNIIGNGMEEGEVVI